MPDHSYANSYRATDLNLRVAFNRIKAIATVGTVLLLVLFAKVLATHGATTIDNPVNWLAALIPTAIFFVHSRSHQDIRKHENAILQIKMFDVWAVSIALFVVARITGLSQVFEEPLYKFVFEADSFLENIYFRYFLSSAMYVCISWGAVRLVSMVRRKSKVFLPVFSFRRFVELFLLISSFFVFVFGT
jgi:hypothetical protein